jgi:hypothetical protein
LILQEVNIKPIPRTNSKALRSFSSIASFIFHPLLIVTYVTIALYNIDANGFSIAGENQFLKWAGIVLLATVFFPFLAILILRLTGLISDAFMRAPKDRILPLTGTLIFYIWAFYFFEHKDSAPLLLKSLLLGAIFSIILDFFINFFYKVSIHTTAAGMMPGNILAFMIIHPSMPVYVLIIAILAAVLVGLIRWWLGAHTWAQILLGYSIGISMQLMAYLILKPV